MEIIICYQQMPAKNVLGDRLLWVKELKNQTGHHSKTILVGEVPEKIYGKFT